MLWNGVYLSPIHSSCTRYLTPVPDILQSQNTLCWLMDHSLIFLLLNHCWSICKSNCFSHLVFFSGPDSSHEPVLTHPCWDLHIRSVQDWWHDAHHDVWVVHGPNLGGVKNYHQRIITKLGISRKFYGLYKLHSWNVVAGHTNIHVQAVSQASDSHGCRWSHHFQEQECPLYRLHRGHYSLPHEV